MKEKKGSILFFGSIAFVVFLVCSAMFSPVATETRKIQKSEEINFLSKGYIKVTKEDRETWFTWQCWQSFVDGSSTSIPTKISENIIGVCDSAGNEYYLYAPNGIKENPPGIPDEPL